MKFLRWPRSQNSNHVGPESTDLRTLENLMNRDFYFDAHTETVVPVPSWHRPSTCNRGRKQVGRLDRNLSVALAITIGVTIAVLLASAL